MYYYKMYHLIGMCSFRIKHFFFLFSYHPMYVARSGSLSYIGLIPLSNYVYAYAEFPNVITIKKHFLTLNCIDKTFVKFCSLDTLYKFQSKNYCKFQKLLIQRFCVMPTIFKNLENLGRKSRIVISVASSKR